MTSSSQSQSASREGACTTESARRQGMPLLALTDVTKSYAATDATEALPVLRHTLAAVRADRRWMAERGMGQLERVHWTGHSAIHHGGRRVFSALGSRAEQLPRGARRALSLEQREDGRVPQALTPQHLGLKLDPNAPFDRFAAAAGLATLGWSR